MSKFERSWILFKGSVSVTLRNRKLLVFPVVTCFCTALIFLFFVAPVALRNTGYRYGELAHWQAVGQTLFTEQASAGPGNVTERSFSLKPAGVIYAGIIYFLSMFSATFFNVAFYHEILGALKGNTVSVTSGLSFACTRLKSILMWTLFAGLVGLIIKTLEEKFDFVGQIILGMIGLAWSVASVFVIPVIITEQSSINPVVILKESARTLKKTWGESLIGYVGLQFGGILLLLGSILYFGAALFASISLKNFWIVAVAGMVWLVGAVALGYVSSVASQVYRCALFLYASEGRIADPYNRELLDLAWQRKTS